MASKRAKGGHSNPGDEKLVEEVAPTTTTVVASTQKHDPIKVNNASLTDLKNACDDSIKKFLGRPGNFQQNHIHTDVRLALGYASVVTSFATAAYGYKVEFEKSKPLVTAGVVLYFLLTFIQTVYAYFIEGKIVFVGKRKTFAKRIETERLTVSSKTIPSTPSSPPQYAVELSYLQTANGGKALIKRNYSHAQKGYNSFFDGEGNMDIEKFEEWAGQLLEKVQADPPASAEPTKTR
ncbi:hypothetical protein SISNIDRAFT_473286 [Sistotremastrum niveocremeum HHB9708]|uniref:Signal peptidase complex subunit 2 n=1 Tax=Sistotremastrum niveocremeum HHB9708 TaxID=1314777 RepID=A0A164XWE4_9AGAM|nr:hypothetical protein SISNIDRAFT_473286 [Sistotremastrum niveocremeum HHB9708]